MKMAAPMSKGEYLKRYLSGKDDKKKKVKKSRKTASARSQNHSKSRIVDDDIDLRMIAQDDDYYVEMGDEAPEIIGVVDDRPEEIRRLEELKEGKWKTVGEDESRLPELVSNKWGLLPSSTKADNKGEPKSRRRHDSDSPRHSIQADSRKTTGKTTASIVDSDRIPKKARHDSDSDNSPPRSTAKDVVKSSASRRTRHDSDSDNSPPINRNRQESDSDQSPPRPRKNADKSDSDQSPPRPRKNADKSDSDLSPVRPKKARSRSPVRSRKDSNRDLSPPRSKDKTRLRDEVETSKQRKGHREKHDKTPPKLEKTLDGKMAGLQTAKSLREENEAFKERERRQFEKMDTSISGRDAKTIIRDRATGKKRNLEEEEKQKAIENEIKAKREAKYQEWGRGLKQKELQKSKLDEDMYEISKPLARYENDVDLDKMLREQEREGDPMLAFIQQKKKPKSGEKDRPKYNGPAPPPNRFDILPGHRWDGVDRSNGFEKSRYTRLNNKVASQDEAYKWSVEDM